MAERRSVGPRRGARYASLLDTEGNPRAERPAHRGRHSVGTYQTGPGASTLNRHRRHGTAGVGKAPAIIAVVLLAAIASGGVWLWLHRSVNITVNGESASVPINTTVAAAKDTLGVTTTPGNLVSVGGNILTAGAGEPYAARVDGQALSIADAEGWQLQGGEEVEYATGADVLEDYTVEVRETAPQLEFDGTWGAISYVAQWGRVRRQELRRGSVSGETADGDVLDEGQNCVVRTTTPEPEGDEGLVALTFDDGPSVYTERYLEILRRYNVHATFFNLGTEEVDFPDAARAVVDGGHEIMSHTNQHLELTALDGDAMRAEIVDAAETIERVTGVRTTSIRPPYGEFTQQCWLESDGLVSLAVLWTQDSEDWKREGVDAIVDNALAGLTSGSIILMHDGGGNRDMDLEALPRLIEAVQAEGYRIVTVSELLAACPDVPADVASGYAPLPTDAVWPSELA